METRNLLITIIFSVIILAGWSFFYERPRLAKLPAATQENAINQPTIATENQILTREHILHETHTHRLHIIGKNLHGSLLLTGLRFDDLTLLKYHETTEPNSPGITILSPAHSKESYFINIGWLSNQSDLSLPNSKSLWKADKTMLREGETVTLTWRNEQGLEFRTKISLDDQYMFTIEQDLHNSIGKNLVLAPYALINRVYDLDNSGKKFGILHEGLIAVQNGQLNEITYEDIKKDKKIEERKILSGWMGMTDKYWLTAVIPDKNFPFDTTYSYYEKSNMQTYQDDYVGNAISLTPGQNVSIKSHIFVGPKKIGILDHYEKTLGIELFDRAVDFGWLYFITKPMFLLLNMINKVVGNFGIAIIVLTVIIKLILFPIANKSYESMYKMRQLQPIIARIKSKYDLDSENQSPQDKAANKTKFNQELVELYRREKVNPMTGCLPIVLQIPIFFALYKVLFITIEMRQAPFFGWIHDLSAPDPTSLFNMFGLINWDPPSFLMIGVWPVIMGITMYIQQMLNPEPSDPTQAKVMKLLPLLFVMMFYSFPSGLIIYWTSSNILSIVQQLYINHRIKNLAAYRP